MNSSFSSTFQKLVVVYAMSGMSDSLYLGQFGVIALWQFVNGKVGQFAKGMCAFQWLSSSGLSSFHHSPSFSCPWPAHRVWEYLNVVIVMLFGRCHFCADLLSQWTNVLTAGLLGVSIRNIVILSLGLWVHVHMCPIAVPLVDHS